MHVFSGHSLELDGQECIILNERDDDDPNFCIAYKAEYKIREFAADFPNSYHVGIFCCKKFSDIIVEECVEEGTLRVQPVDTRLCSGLTIKPSE